MVLFYDSFTVGIGFNYFGTNFVIFGQQYVLDKLCLTIFGYFTIVFLGHQIDIFIFDKYTCIYVIFRESQVCVWDISYDDWLGYVCIMMFDGIIIFGGTRE